MTTGTNLWTSTDHALEYLGHADTIPHRGEGEAEVLEIVPRDVRRILDLGTGDGRLLALLKRDRPQAESVGLDFSPAMLDAVRKRFATEPSVTIVAHNLDNPIPALGKFDAVVSSFAIHHLTHERKRALYAEVYSLLTPGGVFCNLEHVAPATADLHNEFLRRLNVTPENEDPSNKLLERRDPTRLAP